VKLSQKRLARPSLGGVLATRQGALALALLCAVAAAAILVFAMGRYRKSVQTTVQQNTVLVATGEIQQGTSGAAIAAQGLFKSTPILSTSVSPGAINDAGQLQGKVAASDILPGQQLTAADFTAPGGVLGQLAPGQRAVSVSIDEAHGDTDVLAAGDRVDVYGEFTAKGSPVISLLIPDALVLKPAGGSAPAAATTGVATGTSLVLAVSSAQAPEVAYADDIGKLWVVLRPANATGPVPSLTTLSSILTASLTATPSGATSTATGKHP
jgi:pilus assembly protein CpaB